MSTEVRPGDQEDIRRFDDLYPSARPGVDPEAEIAPGAYIGRTAVVTAGSTIAEGAVVEDGAVVDRSVIGPRAHLSAGSRAVRSRIRADARLDTDSTVTGSLVGAWCRIGEGAWIENSTIGTRCMIDDRAKITDSEIGPSGNIGADAVIHDSKTGACAIVWKRAVIRNKSTVGRRVEVAADAVIDGAAVPAEAGSVPAGAGPMRMKGGGPGYFRYRDIAAAQAAAVGAVSRGLKSAASHVPHNAEIDPEVWIHFTARIEGAVIIRGPVRIGAHVRIGAGARIEGAVDIDEGAQLAGNTIVDAAAVPGAYIYIGRKAGLAVRSTVQGSVHIGNRAKVEATASIAGTAGNPSKIGADAKIGRAAWIQQSTVGEGAVVAGGIALLESEIGAYSTAAAPLQNGVVAAGGAALPECENAGRAAEAPRLRAAAWRVPEYARTAELSDHGWTEGADPAAAADYADDNRPVIDFSADRSTAGAGRR